MNHTANFHKFKDALRHALIHYEDKNVKKGQALRHIANSLIHVAINGNERDRMAAIKELADRLDGKVAQAVTGVEGEPITVVERVIVQQVAQDTAESDNQTPRIEKANKRIIN